MQKIQQRPIPRFIANKYYFTNALKCLTMSSIFFEVCEWIYSQQHEDVLQY